MVSAQDILTSLKGIDSRLVIFGIYNKTYERWAYIDLKYVVPSDSFNWKSDLIINGTVTNLPKDGYHVLVEDREVEDPEIGEKVQLKIFYIGKW